MVIQRKTSFLLLVLLALGFMISVVIADPSGPNTFTIDSQSRMNTSGLGGSADSAVWAGNISRITISGMSLTTHWAGFYGNITGTITLDDENNKTLYNWSNSDPQGEIIATTATIVNWSNGPASDEGSANRKNLRCWENSHPLNFGLSDNGSEDTNRTELEHTFGLSVNDVDGVDETFLAANNHRPFTIGSANFTANHCPATNMFNINETQTGVDYEEVMLYDDTNNAVLWTALISNNSLGFTGGQTDWEMMVLENANGTDTAPTTYYFYVELT